MARRMRAEGGMNSKMLHPYRAHFKSETPTYHITPPRGEACPTGKRKQRCMRHKVMKQCAYFLKGLSGRFWHKCQVQSA